MDGRSERRSGAPDLIFEDQQAARVAEIAHLLETPEAVDEQTPLHRLTVFATYACNLACPYCKTIARSPAELAARPWKRHRHDLDSFARLLEAHRGTPIRHLHFTGGEAALVQKLPEMIQLARARGVERVSLTSNGTVPARVYLALIRSGLDELRVSIDAADPQLAQALTGRPRAFDAVLRTLEGLGRARREGLAFFLIFNTVVGRENRARLPELVRFLLGFSPDDLKLITEVELRGELGEFPEAEAVQAELASIVEGLPPERFPLLRRKLATVFRPDAIGLESEAPREDWRCYIPLTERTVDRDFYYPCSVYLREGGRPLGPLTDAPEVQRGKVARFVREADCQRDPICRRYCLACTRAFNARANEART